MQLSWEAVTAIASLFSSIVVLLAVVVAVRQVRVGAAQVEHLRRATQLEGTMKIFGMLGSAEQQTARRFIAVELAERLKDQTFRDEVSMLSMGPSLEEHRELPVLRLMEMIGTYVKHGLLDAEIVFDYWVPAITSTWERLESLGIIAIHREAVGPEIWENFEALYLRGRRWMGHSPERGADGCWEPFGAVDTLHAVRNEVVADGSAT